MNNKTVIHVVDDDAAMRDSLAFLLDVNGFKPEVYESANAFLSGRSADKLSCVISDIRMPGLSGIELVKELKKSGTFLLPGFAKFVVIKKPATKERQGINPFTKEPTVFKAKPARKISWPQPSQENFGSRKRKVISTITLGCRRPSSRQIVRMRSPSGKSG